MFLTSLNRMRFYIGGAENPLTDSTANNRELSTWISSVSAKIERYLNRNLHIESRTEYKDVTYNEMIYYLKAYPILSISSVYEDYQGIYDGIESEITTSDYHQDKDNRGIVLVYPRGYVADRAIRVIYTGGMAYHAVNSVFTVTKTGTWTVGRYVKGSTSGAVGLLKVDGTTSFTVEVLYGVFESGETLTESTTDGGGATAGVSAVITAVSQRSMVEAYPEIVTACESEVRFMWKHKMDFENVGTDKDSTSRRSTETYDLQPETKSFLQSYRNYTL